MLSTNESVQSHGTTTAATSSAPATTTFTNNAALLLLFLILLLIHSAGFSYAKQLISASRSLSSSSSSSTIVPIVPMATTTMVPKPEHKTYPDQNVLIGRVAHLPCHMSGQFSDQQPEPLQESEDGSLFSKSVPLPSSSSSQTTTSSSLEMIQLILWYHGDDISGSPFYSVDARVNHHHQQQHNQILLKNQSDTSSSLLSPINQWQHFMLDSYNGRATFVVNHFQNYHQQPLLQKNNNNFHQNYHHRPSSFTSGLNLGSDHHHYQSPFTLIIDPVLESDQGLYWCRVDYRWTRTTISKVRLNVYLPPKNLTIYQLEPPLSSVLPAPLFSHMDGVNFEFTKNKNNIEDDDDDNIHPNNFHQPTQQHQLESNLMVQFIDQLNQILANQTTKSTMVGLDAASGTSAKMFFPLNLTKIAITSSPRTLYNSSGQFDSSSADTYHYNYQPLNSKQHQQQQQQQQPQIPKATVDESIASIFMCQSSGGNPTPTIQWYWNNRRLPISVEVVTSSTRKNGTLFAKILPKSSDPGGGKFHVINLGLVQDPSIFVKLFKIVNQQEQPFKPIVLSFLWIQHMERSDLGTQIRCQSSNAPQVPFSKSLSSIVRLEINLNPIKAQIVDVKRDGLFSGSTIHATCLTWGAKPAAKIFWFLDDRRLMDVSEMVFESNFTTKSQVRLIIHSNDNGRTLTCLAIRIDQNHVKKTDSKRIHSSSTNNNDDFNDHQKKREQPESESTHLQLLLFKIIKQILSSKPLDKNGPKMRDGFLKNHNNNNNNNNDDDNDSKRKTGKKIENYDNDDYGVGDSSDDDPGTRLLINKTSLPNPFFTLPFVYDQMTLMVEYLPNITIDLLETGPINVVDDTRRPDERQEIFETKTMNENIDSAKNGGPPKNRNRKIFVKHHMKLRCWVDANPPPYRIRWLLNHRDISTLLPSNEYRLTNDNRTLSIDGPKMTGIGRQHEGTYQCSAFNQLGRGDSNELFVSVLRAPKCVFKSENRKKSIKSSRTMMVDSGVNVNVGPLPTIAANVESQTPMTKIDSNINYPANLFCQVDATLPSTSSFSSMIDDRMWIYWQLPNNPNVLLTVDQRGRLLSIPKDKLDLFRRKRLRQQHQKQSKADVYGNGNFFEDVDVESDDDFVQLDPIIDNHNRRLVLATNNVRSRLTIIPQTEQDFGLYQCWAENVFGSNRDEPCLFNLTNSINSLDQRASSRKNHHRWPWFFGVPAPVNDCTTNYSSINGIISIRCQHQDRDRTQQANDRNRNLQFHLILKKFSINHHHHYHHRKSSAETIPLDPLGTTSLSSMLINQTNPIEPLFLISNVQPSSIYEAIVFASNDFGNSSQLRLLIKLEKVSLGDRNESTSSVITSVHQQPQHDIGDGQENRMKHPTNDLDDGDDDFDSFESFMVASSTSPNYPVFNDYDYEDNGVGSDDHADGHRPAIIVGKPDLHQQKNSFTQFNERKNGFYSGLNNNHNDDNDDGVGGGSDSLNRSPNLATKIPLSSLDHRHGDHHNLNDGFQTQNNNRFVLIMVVVFTIVLITFSALLSIAIGFCLYRRKRSILIRRHQEQLRHQEQKQQSQQIQKDQDSLIITDDDGKVIRKSPLTTYETYPLDHYATGVFILDTSGGGGGDTSIPRTPTASGQASIGGQKHSLDTALSIDHHRPMMVYRDFVTSPPSSTTSPPANIVQPQPLSHVPDATTMYMKDFNSTTATPEFLYQPTTDVAEFLDLGVDSGNVQLIPSAGNPHTFISYSDPHETSLSSSSPLNIDHHHHLQQSMFCLNPITTEMNPIESSVIIPSTEPTDAATTNI